VVGVAYDGPLSGCTVCADTNGNGGCDGGEPTTATNATGGYQISITGAQRLLMLAEQGGFILRAADACTDAFTGLSQRYDLVARDGALSINPLSTLVASLPATQTQSSTTIAAARLSRNARFDGRRLTFEQSMVSLRTALDLNQSLLLSTIDLASYDAYAAVNAGRDYCMASGLLVRAAQIQSMVLQAATVEEQQQSVSSFALAATNVLGRLATHAVANGFASFAIPSSFDALLPADGLSASRKLVLGTAMASSFSYLDSTIPNCPPLNQWQTTVLSLHNTRRARHCSPPLAWDDSLAQSADVVARTCPVLSAHNSPANENVVTRATASGDAPEQAVVTLFQTWYEDQAPNYAGRYGTALGICPGGFSFSVANGTECVQASASRVREFTNLLWQTHETVGCSYQQCALGKTLVCHYGRRNCQDDTCPGLQTGQFQANVLPVSSAGPGPCTQRAWDSVVNTARAAFAGQDFLPTQIGQLLSGAIDEAAFTADTSASSMLAVGAGASIPVTQPLPPQPPSPPAPSPPVGGGGTGTPLPDTPISTQTTNGGGGANGGTVAGIVLGITLPLLLCCIGAIVVYRLAGGEPGVWAKVHYTHSNPKVAFRYATDEEREQAAADLAIYQKAMGDAMGSYTSRAIAYWNMRRDHLNFIQAGGLEVARGDDTQYAAPYPEKEQKDGELVVADVALKSSQEVAPARDSTRASFVAAAEAAPAAAPASSAVEDTPAPARVLPNEPQIDKELDAEFAESPEDRVRRIEWIKYFVREGDLQRAFDLGWDGKPFRQAAMMSRPLSEEMGTNNAARLSAAPAASPAAAPAASPAAAPAPSPAAAPAGASADTSLPADFVAPPAPAETSSTREGKKPAVIPSSESEAGPSGSTDYVTMHRI